MSLPGDPDEQALRYARDLSRLQALRRQYETFLPRRLDPLAPADETPRVRTATVLFTDVRGFTAVAERLADDPAGLLTALNEHLTAVVRAITRAGGAVEKFLGDGVMATFGARDDQPDHRERALAAALGVLTASEVLHRRRAADWGFRLPVAVAAATGPLVIGRIGPPERSEMGILGDTINVAARLVAQAEPDEMLLAADLYHALQDTIRADTLGQLVVRGRAGPVDVYRISFERRSPA